MAAYVHQTLNHLFFDRVRAVEFEIELLRDHLSRIEEGRIGGSGLQSEIDALNRCSVILFDDVYKSIREKWE